MIKEMFALALMLAFAASSTSAATTKEPKAGPEPRYDPATVIDIKATITEIREIAKTNPLDGLHFTVKMGTETFDIYVGPADFVKVFDMAFATGDKIQVIGSKAKLDGAEVVLARELHIGDVTLLLRAKDGTPFWGHWVKLPQQ
jgi:hypothetical protein